MKSFQSGSILHLSNVAPSFPAAFPIDRQERVVGALHELGFNKVMEGAIGTDLTSSGDRRFAFGE